MEDKHYLRGLAWRYPKSFLDRYFDDSRAYIRWGYALTFFPLLLFIPFSFLVLERDVAILLSITHAFLAVVIGFLIYLTYASHNRVLVQMITFAAFVTGGTSLNAAAFFNSSAPIVYITVGHFECMLLLFIGVRAPWVLTIPYGVFVIATFSYIATRVWVVDALDGAIIATALIFVQLLVAVGSYARDKHAWELYRTQDTNKKLENERVIWSRLLTQFLNHELASQIAGITTSFQMMSREQSNRDNRFISRGLRSVSELRQLVLRASEAVNIDDLVEDLDVQSIDIIGLLSELVVDYEDKLTGGRALRIDNEYENRECFVRGDYLLLKQMFRNIVDNALRHSNPGSVVRLILTTQGSVEVVDEGDFLPDDIEGLFNFGVKDGSQKSGLYGLGLYLARKIALAHEGNITARRPEGFRGAVFSISLPEAR